MTSKERVLAACRRQKTDRVPINYQARPSLTDRLMDDLGLDDYEELLRRLHVDFRWLSPFYAVGQPVMDWKTLLVQDAFGVKKGVKILESGVEFGYCAHRPLENAETIDDIVAYDWPGEQDVFIHDFSQQFEAYEDYAVITGPWTPIFCQAEAMRGDENMLTDLAADPEMARAIFDRIFGFYFATAQKQFEAVKGKADIFFTGDDFGSQFGLMVSRDMWREYFLPYYKRLFSLAKDYGLLCMMHSCGAVSELFDLFIEAGADIVDPIQVTARGMEPAALKARFGDRLAFHGAIDMQHLLPLADKDTVRKETLRLIDVLGKNGGFIMCSTNEMLLDIPTENILAAYDAQF